MSTWVVEHGMVPLLVPEVFPPVDFPCRHTCSLEMLGTIPTSLLVFVENVFTSLLTYSTVGQSIASISDLGGIFPSALHASENMAARSDISAINLLPYYILYIIGEEVTLWHTRTVTLEG